MCSFRGIEESRREQEARLVLRILNHLHLRRFIVEIQSIVFHVKFGNYKYTVLRDYSIFLFIVLTKFLVKLINLWKCNLDTDHA